MIVMEEGCDDTAKADIGKKEISNTCEECIKEKLRPVRLRVCLTCGHVGCCDSSVGRHATRHFNETKHPVMAEFPSRAWIWCYAHQSYGYPEEK